MLVRSRVLIKVIFWVAVWQILRTPDLIITIYYFYLKRHIVRYFSVLIRLNWSCSVSVHSFYLLICLVTFCLMLTFFIITYYEKSLIMNILYCLDKISKVPKRLIQLYYNYKVIWLQFNVIFVVPIYLEALWMKFSFDSKIKSFLFRILFHVASMRI